MPCWFVGAFSVAMIIRLLWNSVVLTKRFIRRCDRVLGSLWFVLGTVSARWAGLKQPSLYALSRTPWPSS